VIIKTPPPNDKSSKTIEGKGDPTFCKKIILATCNLLACSFSKQYSAPKLHMANNLGTSNSFRSRVGRWRNGMCWFRPEMYAEMYRFMAFTRGSLKGSKSVKSYFVVNTRCERREGEIEGKGR
jgi:hypothetical protein